MIRNYIEKQPGSQYLRFVMEIPLEGIHRHREKYAFLLEDVFSKIPPDECLLNLRELVMEIMNENTSI